MSDVDALELAFSEEAHAKVLEKKNLSFPRKWESSRFKVLSHSDALARLAKKMAELKGGY